MSYSLASITMVCSRFFSRCKEVNFSKSTSILSSDSQMQKPFLKFLAQVVQPPYAFLNIDTQVAGWWLTFLLKDFHELVLHSHCNVIFLKYVISIYQFIYLTRSDVKKWNVGYRYGGQCQLNKTSVELKNPLTFTVTRLFSQL